MVKPILILDGIKIYENVVYEVKPFTPKEHNSYLDNVMQTDATSVVKSVAFLKFDNDNRIRVHLYPDKDRKCYHPELSELKDKISITGIDIKRNSDRESFYLKQINRAESELDSFKSSVTCAQNEFKQNKL